MTEDIATKSASRNRAALIKVLDGDVLIASYSPATGLVLSQSVDIDALSPAQAVLLGELRARQDVLAFLRSRQRAADTVARNNPAECERAKIIAQQIGVEIEAIEQGLHEGCAGKEAALDAAAAQVEG